jgi:hypothetical protein
VQLDEVDPVEAEQLQAALDVAADRLRTAIGDPLACPAAS